MRTCALSLSGLLFCKFALYISGFTLAEARTIRLENFPKRTISVAGESLEVEVADTPARQSQGLMYRSASELPDGKGMLFPYDEERYLTFWMKNTKIPLTIGFFDARGKLVDVQDMEPGDPKLKDHELPRTISARPAKYALEVPAGWFRRKKIPLGSQMEGHQ